MVEIRPRLAIAALALALGGCTWSNGVHTATADRSCIADAAERVAKVDWAKPIAVRIRQGEFKPVLVSLRKDTAYVLRLTNDDDRNRVFGAPEFFAAVAVGKVAVGDEVSSARCISAITVPPNATAEVQIVAVRDGRYDFEETPLVLGPVLTGYGAGVVIVR